MHVLELKYNSGVQYNINILFQHVNSITDYKPLVPTIIISQIILFFSDIWMRDIPQTLAIMGVMWQHF